MGNNNKYDTGLVLGSVFVERFWVFFLHTNFTAVPLLAERWRYSRRAVVATWWQDISTTYVSLIFWSNMAAPGAPCSIASSS